MLSGFGMRSLQNQAGQWSANVTSAVAADALVSADGISAFKLANAQPICRNHYIITVASIVSDDYCTFTDNNNIRNQDTFVEESIALR